MDIKRSEAEAALVQQRKEIEETFKLDPLVKIQLKGVEYTLEYNNLSVKGIYKDTGYNLLSTSLGKDQMDDPNVMGALLFYGLKTHHDAMTQEEADKLYTYRHVVYIMSRITTALELFVPASSNKDLADPDEAGSPQVSEDPTKPPVNSG